MSVYDFRSGRELDESVLTLRRDDQQPPTLEQAEAHRALARLVARQRKQRPNFTPPSAA